MFRFLLEANENLAVCTTLDRRQGIYKLVFPPDNRDSVLKFLQDVQRTVACRAAAMPESAACKSKPEQR